MNDPQEFYPLDRWTQSLIPRPGRIRKIYCLMTGGHKWRKFLWGGIVHPFDCDCCMKCYKFRGPLSQDRTTDVFPCKIPSL